MGTLPEDGELDPIPDEPGNIVFDDDRVTLGPFDEFGRPRYRPRARLFAPNHLDRCEQIGRVPPMATDHPMGLIRDASGDVGDSQ